jgi:hypothetical protein
LVLDQIVLRPICFRSNSIWPINLDQMVLNIFQVLLNRPFRIKSCKKWHLPWDWSSIDPSIGGQWLLPSNSILKK